MDLWSIERVFDDGTCAPLFYFPKNREHEARLKFESLREFHNYEWEFRLFAISTNGVWEYSDKS